MGPSFYTKMASRLWTAVDSLATEIIQADRAAGVKRKWGQKPPRAKLLSPEEEVRTLIKSASRLEDIWEFFLKRLGHGPDLDFLCFSILDESEDFIRLRFLHPQDPEKTPNRSVEEPIISFNQKQNHLIQAYTRRDTTFTGNLKELGEALQLALDPELTEHPLLNIFSIPLIAGNRVIAMISIGFSEIDAFSQAKLSYVYTLRDQIAQLVWNLILQERMQSQAQLDNLTGLFSHSYFQQTLEAELQEADLNGTCTTMMLLDINNLEEINNALGHEVGDQAICHLASTVRRLIRGLDTVARYGADEVAIILPETDGKTAAEIAERFIHGVRDRLPAQLKDLSVSIGYATYPADTAEKDALLKLAEQAANLAKFKGSKTGESSVIAAYEMEQLNDKTVLEVFASHIAKKYTTHGPSVFQELVKRIEDREEGIHTPEDMMLETIGSLAGALDAKDKYTRGHSQAVANYAVALAHAMEMNAEAVEQVRLAAFLHDIGKIGIPESILCKPGPLNENEWEIMKQHPVIGARQILAPVSALKEIIPMVEFHHENWDGSGHPVGLQGEAIPLGARIVSIVDAFHALTSDRSYRKALPIGEAKKVLEEGAGTKWDPALIEVFINILNIAAPQSTTPPSGPTSN